MAGDVTVRFSEVERYDINIDREVIMFMATTDRGSYFIEVPIEGAKSVRENRHDFKEIVMECIEEGIEPCEVELG